MSKAAFEQTFGTPEERARRIANSPKMRIHGDKAGLYDWMTESDFECVFGDPEDGLRRKRISDANDRVAGSSETWGRYPDQWIVVSGCKVVAAEATWPALDERITALGLDRGLVVICYTDTRRLLPGA